MREQVVQFFTNLPSEGIAIHGTNLARAREIEKQGLRRVFLNERVKSCPDVHYYVQPPSMTTEMFPSVRREILLAIEDVASYALRASSDSMYEIPGRISESKTPAIVIFRPLKTFDTDSNWWKAAPFPERTYEKETVPPQNILGIVELNNESTTRNLLKGVVDVITRTVNPSEPQSPDQR